MRNIDIKKYSGIVFDFDGVILDSVEVKTEAFGEIYKKYGEEVVSKVKQYHLLHGGVSRFEKFKYFHNEILGIEIDEIEINNLAKQFNELVFEKVIASPYIFGAKEYIQKVFHSHVLFICTGTPENEMLEILTSLNLINYFKAVYGSPTKKKVILDELMDKFKINANNLVYFGDAMTDYEAATAKNIDFIGVNNGNPSPFPIGTICIDNFKII